MWVITWVVTNRSIAEVASPNAMKSGTSPEHASISKHEATMHGDGFF
jgi:hypothetical protein